MPQAETRFYVDAGRQNTQAVPDQLVASADALGVTLSYVFQVLELHGLAVARVRRRAMGYGPSSMSDDKQQDTKVEKVEGDVNVTSAPDTGAQSPESAEGGDEGGAEGGAE